MIYLVCISLFDLLQRRKTYLVKKKSSSRTVPSGKENSSAGGDTVRKVEGQKNRGKVVGVAQRKLCLKKPVVKGIYVQLCVCVCVCVCVCMCVCVCVCRGFVYIELSNKTGSETGITVNSLSQ